VYPASLAALWGGVLFALVYALFSGWGVPAQRTVIMLMAACWLRVNTLRWPLLEQWLLAAVVVSVWDPWALLQAGFWLSFVAVAILIGSDDPLHRSHRPARWRERCWAWWRQLLREQSLITVALVPMTLVWFGQVSWVSFLANLLAIPWVTLLVTPLAMLGVLVPPLWDVAGAAVAAMVAVLGVMSQWPWAACDRQADAKRYQLRRFHVSNFHEQTGRANRLTFQNL